MRNTDTLIDSQANTFNLRSDVHNLWDTDCFVLFPKWFDGCTKHTLVAHSFLDDAEAVTLYHDTGLHRLSHVPYQYLFARFALAVLSHKWGSLLKNNSTKLSCMVDGTVKSLSREEVAKLIKDDLKARTSGRRTSPLKRSRSTSQLSDPADCVSATLSDSSIDDPPKYSSPYRDKDRHQEHCEPWIVQQEDFVNPRRGRKRRRS